MLIHLTQGPTTGVQYYTCTHEFDEKARDPHVRGQSGGRHQQCEDEHERITMGY